jgi:hypothetical protein
VKFILRILGEVKGNPNVDFKECYLRKTEAEKGGKYKEWVKNFEEEEFYYRIRMFMRKYLKDLKELIDEKTQK